MSGVSSLNFVPYEHRLDKKCTLVMEARHFNGDLSKWDVSKVTTMESMFQGAWNFNASLLGLLLPLRMVLHVSSHLNMSTANHNFKSLYSALYLRPALKAVFILVRPTHRFASWRPAFESSLHLGALP